MPEPQLHVVMYHYVRDLARTRFPRLHALAVDAFRKQVAHLQDRYEMATLESALALVKGTYQPPRDLCLLTFDDGLKEHYTEVMPILLEAGVQGVFFLITGCLEQQRVAAVHKNHFLTATLGFSDYRAVVLDRLQQLFPQMPLEVGPSEAQAVYRWDTPEAAQLKYLLNFRLTEVQRIRLFDELFEEHLGDEGDFAEELYLNWSEARTMQAAGMVMGGHSHRHVALAGLDEESQRADMTTCMWLLRKRLAPQPHWPFSYPYGKPVSAYTPATANVLQELGYACSFSTIVGENAAGENLFALRRIDTKDVSLPPVDEYAPAVQFIGGHP